MELTEVQKEADSAGKKAIGFGVLALLFAVLFGWMLAQLNSGGPETQMVVVAAEDIAPLTKLRLEHLKIVPWPASSIPKKVFTDPNVVIEGKWLTVNGVIAGEPIIEDRLSIESRGLGMSQVVKPDFRAFVVQILDSVAVAELIHPQARVDVIVTLTNPKGQETTSHVLLQNVEVIAVGDSIDVEAQKPRGEKSQSSSDERSRMERHRVVTLSVALADLESLTLASRQGKIDLALRNNDDARIVISNGMSTEQMMHEKKKDLAAAGASAGDAPAAPAPETHSSMPARSHDKPAKHHRDADNGPSIYKVHH